MSKNALRLQPAGILLLTVLLASCSMQRQIAKQAGSTMLQNPVFGPAHVGISIFDPASGKSLYNHNNNKLFVPASNTKLFSCYAAMQYLGDSLPAVKYIIDGDHLLLQATGDPTFLHPDFKRQPLYDFLTGTPFSTIALHSHMEAKPLGRGWAWDDYPEDYMAERDPFPMYGNVATFTYRNDSLQVVPRNLAVVGKPEPGKPWSVERALGGHFYVIKNNSGNLDPVKTITMAMENGSFAANLLEDTLHAMVESLQVPLPVDIATLYSQPTDSMLRMMMHRSDNFFAEQSLLMVSNKLFGKMNDRRVIDSLLKTDFAGLPQRPQWVDGSGLSRYNLFSPADFVWLLNNMRTRFGMQRLQTILPTGNTGTLRGLYTNHTGRIFAKTGTLSNNVALSGYIITKQNKTLIFSVLVNNHTTTAANIRKGIEAFLVGLMERY